MILCSEKSTSAPQFLRFPKNAFETIPKSTWLTIKTYLTVSTSNSKQTSKTSNWKKKKKKKRILETSQYKRAKIIYFLNSTTKRSKYVNGDGQNTNGKNQSTFPSAATPTTVTLQ